MSAASMCFADPAFPSLLQFCREPVRRIARARDCPGHRWRGGRPLSVDMSAAAIEARLRAASDMAGSLRPEDRLDTKIDL
jgi:hypothetical protein